MYFLTGKYGFVPNKVRSLSLEFRTEGLRLRRLREGLLQSWYFVAEEAERLCCFDYRLCCFDYRRCRLGLLLQRMGHLLLPERLEVAAE